MLKRVLIYGDGPGPLGFLKTGDPQDGPCLFQYEVMVDTMKIGGTPMTSDGKTPGSPFWTTMRTSCLSLQLRAADVDLGAKKRWIGTI